MNAFAFEKSFMIIMLFLFFFILLFLVFILVYSRWVNSLKKELKKKTEEIMKVNKKLEEKSKRLEASRKALLSLLEESEKAYEELKQLDKLKTEFMRVASHELRTPLTSIMLSADLLVSEVKEEKAREHAEMIKRNSEKLKQLLDELLDFERLKAGAERPFFKKASFSKVINEALEEVKPLLEAKKLKVKKKIPRIPLFYFDPEKIRRVMVNLLTNAIKFDDKGPIEVTVEKKRNAVVVKVKDHGRGMSKDELSRVFSYFFKAEQEKEGAGLGLNICKQIIVMHKGKIRVKSKGLGKGTTVEFEIPIKRKL